MPRTRCISCAISAIVSVAGLACAGGGDVPSTTSAFDPTYGNAGTGPATGTTTGPDGMTGQATADGTTGPAGGSCCAVAATPGCSDADVESCVCTIAPACCQRAWGQGCVELAIDPCGDPACMAVPPGTTGEPSDSSGEPPALYCDDMAVKEGWTYWRCEADGGSQCNGMGTPSIDCDFCCGYCNAPGDVSCGGLAEMNGWAQANCEWNGNGACGGAGTPTCDCNFCCEVN